MLRNSCRCLGKCFKMCSFVVVCALVIELECNVYIVFSSIMCSLIVVSLCINYIDISLWPFALDNDGFVIPSLGIGDSDQTNPDAPTVEAAAKPPSPKVSCKCYIFIYNIYF